MRLTTARRRFLLVHLFAKFVLTQTLVVLHP
jgi:hypothetical protein